MNAPPWLTRALEELRAGVSEVAGTGDHSRIVEYHAMTAGGASPDEVPWCSSGLCWCVEQAGFRSPRSKRARDWLHWGKALAHPLYGCVCVLRRGSGPQPGPEVTMAPGHVTLWVGAASSFEFLGLGGNQGNRWSISTYPTASVLGYRAP